MKRYLYRLSLVEISLKGRFSISSFHISRVFLPKTFTDNVAMNIALKDSARDKLMPTFKPYLLVGHPSHVGGSINIMQIGKKKQIRSG